MAGLLDRAREALPPEDEPERAGPPVAADEELGEGQEPASAEEQAQYDTAMKNILELIYEGDTVRPAVLNALKAGVAADDKGGDTNFGEKMAVATLAVSLVGTADDSARQAGQPLTDDVLREVGTDVIGELVEIGEAAKILDFSQEDVDGAWYIALDKYRDKAIADGRTDGDTLKAQFGEINQADADGTLDDVLPGLPGRVQPATGQDPTPEQIKEGED